MGRRLIIVGVVSAFLGFAQAASATTETASSGGVTATFTFKGHSFSTYHGERLKITRLGVVLYNQPVSSTLCPQPYPCSPGSETGRAGSVHVLDLEHNGSPDVVLDLYTGGAHCCAVEQFFSFDPGVLTYVKTERNFGDPGIRIADLHHDGRLEILTADDSFAYEFTDYAASGLPVQVFRFANRHFSNVTRSFPKLIRKDAGFWLGVFKSMASTHYQDSVGVIAAWAADQDLLRHFKRVKHYLAKQARLGHLNSPGDPADSGKKFIAKLRRFLRAHGYLR